MGRLSMCAGLAALALILAITLLGATPALAAPQFSPYATSIYQLQPDNPFVGGFEDPEGIAASPAGDAVYVIDAFQQRVVEMTPYGTFVRAWGCCGAAPGKLVKPTGIATDSQGHVWVADNGQGVLDEYRTSGGFLRSFSVPFVFGVAVSPDGKTIYAATHFFNLVSMLSSNGHSLGAFAPCPASQGSELVVTCALRSVATGPNGAVYFLTNHLIHYTELCNPGSNYGTSSPPTAGWDEVDRFGPGSTVQTGTWDVADGPDDCYNGFDTNDYFTGVAIDPNSGYSYTTWAADDQVLWDSPGNTNTGAVDRPPYPSYTSVATGWFTSLGFDCESNLYVTSYDEGAVIRYANLNADPATCSPLHRLLLAPALIGGISRLGNKLSVQIGCSRNCRGALLLYSGDKLLARKTILVQADKTREILLFPDSKLKVGEAIRAVFKPHGLRVARLRTHVLAISTLALDAPPSVNEGQALDVTGSVTPAHRGRRVRLLAFGVGMQTITKVALTNAEGRYQAKLALPVGGVWTLRAHLDASARAQPAVAQPLKVKVLPLPVAPKPPKVPPTVRLTCPSALAPGENLNLQVHGPALAAVGLTITAPGHAPSTRTDSTNADGAFSTTVLVSTPGAWRVTVRLIEGSSAGCTVRVRSPETVMISCPHQVPLPGGSGTAAVSGTTSPVLPGATITVNARGGGGARKVLAQVKSDGSYAAQIPLGQPDIGTVTATASYAGDATHDPATSTICEFTVG